MKGRLLLSKAFVGLGRRPGRKNRKWRGEEEATSSTLPVCWPVALWVIILFSLSPWI